MSPGRQWAAASARTLARRLRRQARLRIGETRAQALATRCKLFRTALSAHWSLGDQLGGHLTGMADTLKAAKLLGLPTAELDDYAEKLASGNWAKHQAPPGLPSFPAVPRAVDVVVVEEFRAWLTDIVFDGTEAVSTMHGLATQDLQYQHVDVLLDALDVTIPTDVADVIGFKEMNEEGEGTEAECTMNGLAAEDMQYQVDQALLEFKEFDEAESNVNDLDEEDLQYQEKADQALLEFKDEVKCFEGLRFKPEAPLELEVVALVGTGANDLVIPRVSRPSPSRMASPPLKGPRLPGAIAEAASAGESTECKILGEVGEFWKASVRDGFDESIVKKEPSEPVAASASCSNALAPVGIFAMRFASAEKSTEDKFVFAPGSARVPDWDCEVGGSASSCGGPQRRGKRPHR
mmetsp:Transcript_82233/g.222786  ORF Transcript_82233/g.222786 Transcript_82233/m.222786 type:complete len:407 (+) Transcript_82233:3-1223(+)